MTRENAQKLSSTPANYAEALWQAVLWMGHEFDSECHCEVCVMWSDAEGLAHDVVRMSRKLRSGK